jgi:hypothetical protein
MKDPRVEQGLKQEGVEWHYEPDVPLTKIDREASLKNQARFKAINQDHVIELAIAAEQSELPALVGYYNTERRIVIIDGNHRMEAYILGGKTKTDFYIVDTAYSWAIERLTRVANVKEGVPPTREEKLKHALYFVRIQNMPVEMAAKMMALPPGRVQDALCAVEVDERLIKLGFNEKLYPSILGALYRIKQDSVLLESAKLVHEAQLTGDEATELARKVSRARSEKAQQVVIERMRHEFRSRIVRTRAGQMRRQILPTIKYRRAIDAINSIRPEQVKPLDKDLHRKSRSAIKKVEEIIQGEPEAE